MEQAFLGRLAAGDVVYDIGANIGWYSLLAARTVGREGHVFAFEPSLENALIARQNAARNGFENLAVVPVALTDENGWLKFLERGSLQGRLDKSDTPAQTARRATRKFPFHGRTLVPASTLDTWIEQTGAPAPSVVKIDVEGAEVGVLRGMANTIASRKPTLIIELHGTREEVADELDRAGYEHSAVETGTATREAPWWAHVLAAPKASPANSR